MTTRRLLGGLVCLVAATLLGGFLASGLLGGCQPPRWARLDRGPEPTKRSRRSREPRAQPVAQQEELARTAIRHFRDQDLAPDAFAILQRMGCDAVPHLFTYALDPDSPQAPEPALRDSPEQLDDIYRIRVGAARTFEMITGIHPDQFGYHADWPREDRLRAVKYLRRWWEKNESDLRQQEAERRAAAAAAAAHRPPATPTPPPPPIPARPTPTAPPPEVSPLPPVSE